MNRLWRRGDIQEGAVNIEQEGVAQDGELGCDRSRQRRLRVSGESGITAAVHFSHAASGRRHKAAPPSSAASFETMVIEADVSIDSMRAFPPPMKRWSK